VEPGTDYCFAADAIIVRRVDTAARVRERWRALEDGAELSGLGERCERAVVEERTVPFGGGRIGRSRSRWSWPMRGPVSRRGWAWMPPGGRLSSICARICRLFGLDALAEQAVVKLAQRINGPIDHQLLGHPRPEQDDPRRPGQIVLLHLADDPDLSFMVMDAGDLHFLGTPQDIQAMRWDQLTVSPHSG
jgi:hypothetical protein